MRAFERLADIFAIFSGAILLSIVGVTTTNTSAFIADRLVRLFGGNVSGLPGYEDFVSLAISGAALMFLPYCQAQRGHVQVDLFMKIVSDRVRRNFDLVWLAVTCLVALFLAYWLFYGLLEVRDDAVVTSVLGWPVWPFYIPGILSMLLWAGVAAAQIREGWFNA